MHKKHLCKITTEEDSFYLLCTKITDDDNRLKKFDLLLYDGNDTWNGTVEAENLKSYSQNLHINCEELLTQTEKALNNDKMSKISFVYEVTPVSKNIKRLTWKRYEEMEDIKFKLGSVELHQNIAPSAGVYQMLEFALQCVGSLEKKVSQLEHENNRLKLERDRDIQKLNKLADSKADIERELYSKFVLVLNDKKAKIRELEEQIVNISTDVVSQGSSHDKKKDVISLGRSADYEDDTDNDNNDDDKPEKNNERLSTDHDSEYLTDEEDESTEKPAKKQGKLELNVSSCSSDVTHLLADDDDNADLPVVTRRRRGRNTLKQQQKPTKSLAARTPSDPPKPTAKPGSSTRSKKHSVIKSADVSSNNSADETCDLIDDI